MLKKLDQITELSETYAHWHNDYKSRLKQLLTEVNNTFIFKPELEGLVVKATETGQIEIAADRLYLNKEGKLLDERITLNAEQLLAIAAIIQTEL